MKGQKNTVLRKTLSVLRNNKNLTVKKLAVKLNLKQLHALTKLNLKKINLNTSDYQLVQNVLPFVPGAINLVNINKQVSYKLHKCRKDRHTQPYERASRENDFFITSFTDVRGPTEQRPLKLKVINTTNNNQALAA